MTNYTVPTYQIRQDRPFRGMNGHRVILVMIAILACFFTVSCVGEFHPWEENKQYHFSIYGYLDASADTQWVRVMPVREELLLEPVPNEFTVNIEHLEAGETVVMKDSLFSYPRGTYAWNFWTTMDIEPEQTYRLTAIDSAGRISSSQITLPADYPSPLVIVAYSARPPIRPISATVNLEGVERLADVRIVHRNVRIPHLKDTVRLSHNHFRIDIDLNEDLQVLNILNPEVPPGSLIDSSSRIYIASAGPDFHYFGSLSEKIISLPEGVSNIENGIGYLAGIISKTIPLENCMAEDTQNIIPCEPEPPPW